MPLTENEQARMRQGFDVRLEGSSVRDGHPRFFRATHIPTGTVRQFERAVKASEAIEALIADMDAR